MKKSVVALLSLMCVATGLLANSYFSQTESPTLIKNETKTKIVNHGSYREFLPAKSIVPFTLQRMKGEFKNEDLVGKWTFVTFGYTYCPDVCPTTLTRIKSVLPALQKISDVQIVFVSADPLRDTPERLSQYVNYFDSSYLGVTTSHDKLFPFAQSLYLPYGIVSAKKEGDYAVNHSASIALINPNGKYQAQFRPQYIAGEVPTVDMKDMAKSFEIIARKFK